MHGKERTMEYINGFTTSLSLYNKEFNLDSADINGDDIKELALGWYDYGARFYDPAVGRFTSVDPLAEQMASWSPFSYTYNNPLRFTDPMGMAPNDIILQGSAEERKLLQTNLQQLTNDRLVVHPETGKVHIERSNSANFGKDLKNGTDLVRTLINDDNTTSISIGSVNGTDAIDESGNKVDRQDIEYGKQYDSEVGVTLKNTSTKNADGSEGGIPGYITLGRELGHARSNAEGTNSSATFRGHDFDGGVARTMQVVEFGARVFENKLRNEKGFKLRALPIPSFFFKP